MEVRPAAGYVHRELELRRDVAKGDRKRRNVWAAEYAGAGARVLKREVVRPERIELEPLCGRERSGSLQAKFRVHFARDLNNRSEDDSEFRAS